MTFCDVALPFCRGRLTCCTMESTAILIFFSSRSTIIVAMISEVVNALLLTYLASEYFVDGGSNNNNKNGFSLLSSTKRRRHQKQWFPPSNVHLILFVMGLNVIDRVSGAAEMFHHLLQSVFHVPRILFAAVAYVMALYYDCRSRVVVDIPTATTSSTTTNNNNTSINKKFTWPYFLRQVGMAFCQTLPLYPFLAVVISFGFLLVISVFEFLRLPLEWLNWPIYYGTLYGPFSLVYWKVKRRVLEDFNLSLPTTTNNNTSFQ